jgi:hypothetical protein
LKTQISNSLWFAFSSLFSVHSKSMSWSLKKFRFPLYYVLKEKCYTVPLGHSLRILNSKSLWNFYGNVWSQNIGKLKCSTF